MHDTGTPAWSPLSQAQQRLWFLHQLRPTDPAYNIVTAVEITGPMAPSAIASATAAVDMRHDVLRATFGLRGARPVQWFPPARLERPRLVDLSGLPVDVRERELTERLAAVAARPFDLARGPVADWTLLRLAPDRHVLVFRAHHIVFDGGSLPVICGEFEELHEAARAGRPACLPTPRPRYADFVRGQAQPPRASDLAYWRRRFADAPARLRVFPPGGSAGSGQGARSIAFSLGRERVAELTALGRRHRCTPFITLLTVFAGLLGRYTGHDDLVIGTPVSLRESEDSQATVGLFLNMLPLRLDLSGDPTLVESLRRTRDVALDAFDHRAVPFEQIVDELRPARDLDYTPVFQVVFAYQQSPRPPRLPGVATRLLPVAAPAAKYDLTVIATHTADDIEITVQADVTSRDPSAALTFAANLDMLLAGSLRDPTQPLSRLTVLGPGVGAADHPPDPGTDRPAGPPVGARTDLERAISAAWCATLAVERVDVRSGFFDAGGTSLLLLDLHARLCATVTADLTLADLFRHPTVAGLAEYLGGVPGARPVSAAAARGTRRRTALARRAERGDGA